MTRTTKLGLAALGLYFPHAAWHVTHADAWSLLWMCDVAMPILALGCFARRPRAVATGFLFLLYGTPLWLLDLAASGASSMVITSPLIHVGGLVVAFLAIRTLGWSPRSWAVASACAAAVLGLSRLLSPRAANINMAFRVYEGWERHFSSHGLYLAGLWLSATCLFWLFERTWASKHLSRRS